MKLYKCDKTVLRFQPKGADFINAYSTNSPEAARSAFVDIHGKIVAVADLQKISQEEMRVIVETKFVGRLLAHLKKYLAVSGTAAEALDEKKVYWDLETKRLLVTDEVMPAQVSQEEFTRFRMQNNLPLQGVDFDEEMVLNLADESLVSYSKGCYLGQEVVARVHYRAHPPKKLVVRSEEECDVQEKTRMTSKVRDSQSGKTIGFVLTHVR